MEKELVKCTEIGVDCVENDPVDIRCGGPEYLGFDFFVLTLSELRVPAINIYSSGERELRPMDV